ncbi:MAG: alpha-glucosidase, partial [Dorea sp.]|nr:alpha-glucosidase [Dorea sp.]
SPIYCSPLADQGYDISDYYNIDPVFGNMEEMELLLKEAKKRDLHILMDLVVNHCSDEHEWFQKACEDPDGKYGKYFYIMDHKDGDPLPCNWRSYFGGPCWEKLPGHDDKIYFHAFHKKQPDLNWENPEVREEIYQMINWWLDKGLAGFRIDAIINIKKVLPFKNYPADRADGLCSIFRMLEEAEGIGEFLGEMAEKTFHPHDAFTVGEVFNEKPGSLPLFIGENGYFSSIYDFSPAILGGSEKGWYDHKPVTAEMYKDAVFRGQARAAGVGFMSTLIENHDEPRGVSHFIPAEDLSDRSKKMLAGLLFLQKGLPFIYQGQEIGMENFDYTSVDEIDDCNAWGEYQVALDAGLSKEEALAVVNEFSRDNARSPFQWDDSVNAGFTDGKPWLGVNPNYKELNLKKQQADPDSVWNFYRQLISLRKNSKYQDVIVYGDTIPYLKEEENLICYYRKASDYDQGNASGKCLLVLGNFQSQGRDLPLPGPVRQTVLNNLHTAEFFSGSDKQSDKFFLHMEGYQFMILELE